MENKADRQLDENSPKTKPSRFWFVSVFLGCCAAAFAVAFVIALLLGNSEEFAVKVGLASMLVIGVSTMAKMRG